jgi:hypothetical protein
MVFDKIKDILTGGGNKDLGDLAGSVGLGEYAKYVEGVTFPIGKDDLMVALQDNNATDAIMAHVQSLTGDKFDGPMDIFKTLLNK